MNHEQNYVSAITHILDGEKIDKARHIVLSVLQSHHEDTRGGLHILHDVLAGFDCITRLSTITPGDTENAISSATFALRTDGTVVRLLKHDAASGGFVCSEIDAESTMLLSANDLRGTSGDVEVLVVQGSAPSFISTPTSVAYHVGYGKEDDHEHHYSTTELLWRLWHFLLHEKKDLLIVFGYSIVMGLLSLALPLASQSLVNAVSLGIYTTQLTVLCVGVAIGLLILGVFQILELTVVDVLRRRIFLRAAFDVAQSLSRVSMRSLEGEYPPELVNRFFDVTTITKTLSKFLLDGISAVLVAGIGLILLAIYHPFFLLFDVFLIGFVVLLVIVLGRGGVRTSIEESRQKYEVAHWLEEIARCLPAFKMSSRRDFAHEYMNGIAEQYVRAHRSHFIVIARQIAGSVVFRTVATVGVLGLGGVLVIDRQLSLGQLVAAELVVVTMLASVEKLISQFEDFYDLLTGIDKLSSLTDRERERIDGSVVAMHGKALQVEMHSVSFTYARGRKVFDGLSMSIPAGSRYSVIGENGSGKTTLTELLAGLYEVQGGCIEFNGRDTRQLALMSVRDAVAVFTRENNVFAGTIRDNICLGRPCTHEHMQWVLEMSGLKEDVRGLRDGINTWLQSDGMNVPQSLMRRIVIARCILGKPGLLVLDEGFNGLELATKTRIIENIYSEKSWTILDVSRDEYLLRRSQRVFGLAGGRIAEEGTVAELCSNKNSMIHNLFPQVQRNLAQE
ncbi:MAG: peptidase domain-containing ABC transporter, partial [Candidatus Kapaibacterium sp.]